MLFLNTHTHKYHDEFVYSHIYGTTINCSNLSDVMLSMKNLYNMHNGRIITTTIMTILLMMPKILSDILNSAFFVLLIYLIYRYAIKNEESNFIKILLIFLIFPMLWYTIPEFNGTITWFSGAVNYMWSTVILLIYFFYILNIFLNNKNISNLKLIIISFFGLIVGSLHESIGIILTSFAFFLFTYNLIINKKFNKTFLIISISSFLGFLSIILSPGIKVRTIATLNGTETLITENIKNSINMFLKTVNSNKFIFISIIVLLIFIIIQNIKNKTNILKNKRFIINLFLILSSILVYIGMVKSPTFAERVTFAPYILFILSFFGLLSNLNNFKIFKIFILSLAVIYFSFNSFFSIKETTFLIKEHFLEWNKRDEFIEKEKQKGKQNILLEPIQTKLNNKMYGGDISYSPTYNHNGSMAMFYDINSVRLKKNYYIDLNFSNLSSSCNNTSITLYNDTELETEKITILPQDVYEKQAPFKKYKHSVDKGNITLYYGINNLDNLTLMFDTNSTRLELSSIKLYNYENINHIFTQNEIRKIINYSNDVTFNIKNNKILLEITGKNPYLKIDISNVL